MKRMKRIVFATNNGNKIKEVQALLGQQYQFLSLADISCHEEIPETTGTIPGNALQKANYVSINYGQDCFSEDTGLEVDALDGRPGVDTAYYAGPQRSAQDNMAKLLQELAGQSDRSAQFRTVIALILNGTEYLFEGIVRGKITKQPKGTEGFGYDPVFIPEGYDQTFAEMSARDKNAISHRGRAVAQLQDFLQQYAGE